MICYTCKKYEKCNLPWKCSDTMQGCTGYHKEQTNEEWLRTLSFNELARVLYCMIVNGDRIRPDLAYIKRWLKAVHKE